MKTFFQFVLATTALLATQAQAVVYCIDDSAEFQTVAAALETPVGGALYQDIDMRFRPGTFSRNTQFDTLIRARLGYTNIFTPGGSYEIRLSGQWNAGCTTQNAVGASTIDGVNSKGIFYAETSSEWSANTNYFINLKFDRLNFIRYVGTGLTMAAINSGNSVEFRHNIFRDGSGSAINMGEDSMIVDNNLFENLSSAGGSVLSLASDGAVTVTNNTFRDGGMPNFQVSNGFIALGNPNNPPFAGTAVFENNIVWGVELCAQFCRLFEADNLTRIRNNIADATSIFGTPLFVSNNLVVNPRFANSTGALLAANSPARDLGSNSVVSASVDLFGNARIQNTVVDLGAHELSVLPDAIFKNSFLLMIVAA
jgi:hypothetical protein